VRGGDGRVLASGASCVVESGAVGENGSDSTGREERKGERGCQGAGEGLLGLLLFEDSTTSKGTAKGRA